MSKLRVLLADDHALFREGLSVIINSQPDMEIIGEANDGLEALVKAQELKPDLILMDVQMPGLDGIEATHRIKHALPDVRIVMLTVQDDDDKLFQALKQGAQGYLLKDIRSKDMLTLIRGAAQGEAALSAHLTGRVLQEFQRISKQVPLVNDNEITPLTLREVEVLDLAATGATDKEIAAKLSISLHTVKSHMRNVLSKLHANSRSEAAMLGRHKGIL